MQGHQDMIATFSEDADPVLWPTGSGIAHQPGSFGGSSDERAKRLERDLWNPILDLQGDQSVPRDRDVQAIVGLAARSIVEFVPGAWLEPDVPVFGGGNLRHIRLVIVNESAQQL